MNRVILLAIELLEKGHVEEADLELRRSLGRIDPINKYFQVMSDAAQAIHPGNQPKEALRILREGQ